MSIDAMNLAKAGNQGEAEVSVAAVQVIEQIRILNVTCDPVLEISVLLVVDLAKSESRMPSVPCGAHFALLGQVDFKFEFASKLPETLLAERRQGLVDSCFSDQAGLKVNDFSGSRPEKPKLTGVGIAVELNAVAVKVG
jgi:hypothetical protein